MRAGRRWAWAEIDLAAIAHNIGVVRSAIGARPLWAVVKADGYGHGAVPVARTAMSAGAAGLCVALVQEGVELRLAGISAPILLLTEQPSDQLDDVITHGLVPTVASDSGIRALADAVGSAATTGPLDVHLKIDTGMHRSGADPAEAVALANMIAAEPSLALHGVLTHLACADEPGAASNDLQLRRFGDALAALAGAGHRPSLVHAANSAGALAIPASRFDMVRIGIAMYGIEPGPGVSGMCADLRPAMSLRARVSRVHRVPAGEGVSYGLRHVFDRDSTVATVPIGYADGVPRRLFEAGGEVLIHGRRMPIVGVVTMDQLMVDCSGDSESPRVRVGDEVVLIGSQTSLHGTDVIRAEDWARRLGTIGYEIVCGIGHRIERVLS